MPSIVTRVIALAIGLSPEDWDATAGDIWRRTAGAISFFCGLHGITPNRAASDLSNYVSGAAHEKLVHALNEAAEIEKKQTETAAMLRSAEVDLRIKEGLAQHQEIENIDALVDLIEKL